MEVIKVSGSVARMTTPAIRCTIFARNAVSRIVIVINAKIIRSGMKKINITIDVCPECPYYDDGYLSEGYKPWCVKHEREVDGFSPPDWCLLEEV